MTDAQERDLRRIAACLTIVLIAFSAAFLVVVICCGCCQSRQQEPREVLEVSDVPLLTEQQKAEAITTDSAAFEAGGTWYVIEEGAREGFADYL